MKNLRKTVAHLWADVQACCCCRSAIVKYMLCGCGIGIGGVAVMVVIVG